MNYDTVSACRWQEQLSPAKRPLSVPTVLDWGQSDTKGHRAWQGGADGGGFWPATV